MAWSRVKDSEYSCMHDDVKQTGNSTDPVDENSTLLEVQSDGSLKGYIFVQGAWRLVGDL